MICNDDDVPQKDSVKIYSSEVEAKKNRRPANLVTTWGEGIKRMTKQQGIFCFVILYSYAFVVKVKVVRVHSQE